MGVDIFWFLWDNHIHRLKSKFEVMIFIRRTWTKLKDSIGLYHRWLIFTCVILSLVIKCESNVDLRGFWKTISLEYLRRMEQTIMKQKKGKLCWTCSTTFPLKREGEEVDYCQSLWLLIDWSSERYHYFSRLPIL